ncbi:hypothetical protein AYO20_01043 [Fonsecaea nubica]|uniref:FAD/NAD(P)-binding domain-containing protein n=1 Tax=Fonsecaea nubica TaxID=856822 RepID=A0A178DCZ4_9EURO|nr:hypothetical protein AYO20_01043 [Fonsecaea nubica]OAL39646.1 hypothetical protein AYO20_01043 [Fonsecaea nubica]
MAVAVQQSVNPQSAAALEHRSLTEPEKVELDFEALRRKYQEERDKRLQNGGINQYTIIQPASKAAEKFLDDPYVQPGFTRDPIQLDTDVIIIGGGFGGLMCAVRLLEQGVTNFRIIEKGGDFGGTWYWNRYPGAQCDIEAYVYMPLLEETNYVPSEKYTHASELLDHAHRIGAHYGLYDKTIFQTETLKLQWNEATTRWDVETNRADIISTRFIIPAAGPLHRPKLPGVPGIDSFKGHFFHSSRWDYDYTGGHNRGDLSKLADKRVGIIGTGATAVQIVPHVGAAAKQLYVFQRTPSSIDVRNNRPTDPEWARSLPKGWHQARMDNFDTVIAGGYVEEDLVADGWTDILRNLWPRKSDNESATVDPAQIAAKMQLADYRKMESIRARVDSIVEDKQTAEALKPWYNQMCKRPCFHDQYLQTFNRPNVKLVDTKGKGIDQITPEGVMANGIVYEIDCLIYATGFELATDWAQRTGMEIYGRDGITTTEKWKDGFQTFHGWTSRGFPNCFFVNSVQAAVSPNFLHATAEQARHFAYVVRRACERNVRTLEPTAEAENAWVQLCVELAEPRRKFLEDCTPGYYNNEGDFDDLKTRRNVIYGGGSPAFFELTRKWRADDRFEGLEVTYLEEEK